MYSLDDYFGISGEELAAMNNGSSQAPTPAAAAGPSPIGRPGTLAAFTDWRHSPTFWLAVLAVFALGMIHAEGRVRVALK